VSDRIHESSETLILGARTAMSLRLQPPVPSGSPRSVNKGAGVKVLGKWYADTTPQT